MSADAEETQQRLKAALYYTVGLMCQRVGEENKREFSKQVIAAIAETTYRQTETFAKDLEAFAKHGKRTTVSTEDVKLLARRSTSLFVHIKKKSEEVTEEQRELKKSKVKKRGKDTEEDRE